VTTAPPSRKEWLAIAGLTSLALAVRSLWLGGRGLWLDEGWTVYLAHAAPAEWLEDVHPPLHAAALGVWQRAGGEGDAWLRLLSAGLGAATVPVVWALGRRLLGSEVGLWAAALLSVTSLHVMHSQEVRMYALLTLLVAGALWGLVVGAGAGRVVGWVVYSVCAAGLLYAHGLGALYVVALALLLPLAATAPGRLATWWPWIAAHAVAGLAWLPWAAAHAAQTRRIAAGGLLDVTEQRDPPLLATVWDLTVASAPPLSSLLRVTLGLSTPPALGRWPWLVVLLAVLALAAGRGWRAHRRALRFLVAAYAVPVVVLTAVHLLVVPMLRPRLLLPTAVPLTLLLAASALTLTPRRAWNRLALIGVMLILALGTVGWFRHVDPRGDWRGVAQQLGRDGRPGDVLLLNMGWLVAYDPRERQAMDVGWYLLRRYDAEGRLDGMRRVTLWDALGRCPDAPERCLAEALEGVPPGATVWVLHAHVVENERLAAWRRERLESRGRLGFGRPLELERAILRPAGP
jgi:4-amino-4-deoxy-L-arabinose transferase-like glycosyltransferase